MSEHTAQTPKSSPRRSRLARYAIPIGTMSAALGFIAVIYLGYDLAKGKMAPCEAIFQQTSVGLSTRISFLKTEGELQIGRDTLTELDDRAKMAALNLKTCCTVLDAGRLDPEQFLQCKSKARSYESHVGEIVALVKEAVADGMTTASVATPASAAAATLPAAPPPTVRPEIKKEIEAARSVSREFNTQVVQVRKEQALETLEATPPQDVTVDAQEREPNDSTLATNTIELGKWVTGSIGAGKDADFYKFTTPETHRDWIRMELQNRSTTLEPRMQLFDADKASLGSKHNTTVGADLNYSFVAPPGTTYIVRVSNYYGENLGVYLLRIVATESYDEHEPNEDILNPRKISAGQPIEAAIMDGGDADFFQIDTGDGEVMLNVQLANRSTTLRPQLALYNADKAHIGSKHNTTSGGNIGQSVKAAPNSTYYVRVRDYYGDASGEYTLTVTEEEPKAN